MQEKSQTLGDRMKEYEKSSEEFKGDLKSPVIIRLDGQSFHTWVKKAGLKRPFDERLISTMEDTLLLLCENIQNCVFGYTQSDEISLLLRSDFSEHSEPWFGNRMQKLCSISASMCSAFFNSSFSSKEKTPPLAFFDSRVIFLPNLEECMNYFIWRQNDCIKNSISGYAQSMFSAKELLHKGQEDRMNMIRSKGEDWNELSEEKKYGIMAYRKDQMKWNEEISFFRKKFFLSASPIFSKSKSELLDWFSQ